MFLYPFNMSKCRACYTSCEMKGSFYIHEEMPFLDSVTISDVLKEVANIQVSDDDRFPRKICAKCCSQLKDAHLFIRQVQEVDKLIHESLNEDYNSSLPYIVSVDHSLKNDIPGNKDDVSMTENKFLEVKCEPSDNVLDQELINECDIKKEPDFEKELHAEYLDNQNDCESFDFMDTPTIKEEPLENDFTRTEEVEYSQGLLINHYTEGSVSNDVDDDDDVKPTKEELENAEISYNLNQEQNFFCNRCKEPLESKDALCKYNDAHKAVYERCMLCNKYFNTHDKLKNHVILCHTYNYEKCSKCELSFTTQKDLIIHLDSHKSINPELQCPNCPNESFSTFRQLQDHSSKHYRKRRKTLICEFCSRKFANKSAVSRHLKFCIRFKHSSQNGKI